MCKNQGSQTQNRNKITYKKALLIQYIQSEITTKALKKSVCKTKNSFHYLEVDSFQLGIRYILRQEIFSWKH